MKTISAIIATVSMAALTTLASAQQQPASSTAPTGTPSNSSDAYRTNPSPQRSNSTTAQPATTNVPTGVAQPSAPAQPGTMGTTQPAGTVQPTSPVGSQQPTTLQPE